MNMAMSARKRWVTPSFDSTSDEVPPVKKSSVQKVEFRRPKVPTPIVSQSEHKSKTWLERYQPKSVDELVIHPKKVKELEDWFHTHRANQHEKYLVLVGPCGCGKTISLRVMAKKFQFDVLEWITPLDRDFDPDLHGQDQTYQSAAEIFQQFLSRATRYPSLLNAAKSKIILVKDFPNVFVQRPEILHDILRKYLLLHTYPVAFVCNDDSLARTLLPDALRKECNMRTINFNPVHCKAVIKALERVLELERKFNPDIVAPEQVDLKGVYSSSAGDLRSAILKLYLDVAMTTGDSRRPELVPERRTTRLATKAVEGRKSKKSGAAGGKENVETVKAAPMIDKNANTDLFHLLGRVIYSSRQCPDHSRPEDYRFVHDPNELADTCISQPYSFVSFLQENYASRFSSIKSICSAADRLRHADVMMANFAKETNATGLAVAIRGLMVANDHPVKSFKPFVKARSFEDVLRTHLSDEIRQIFPHFQHSVREIVLYTLPLLGGSPYQFNDSQRKIVDKLSAAFRK